MKLTVVTINYNGFENTIKLLKSLAVQTDNNFQAIVIDNASNEADFNNLKTNCPTCDIGQFKLIRNNQNLGFSGGNNVGIREALRLSSERGQDDLDWILLLNNDTLVGKEFIASLKAKLNDLEGVVGVPLSEGDHVAYCGIIEWLKPTLLHKYDLLKDQSLKTKTLDFRPLAFSYYVIGGAMAIHRNVFSKIGLLDEKYFLYFEDADYTIRARKAKIPITFAQDVMIYHNTSSTTKKLGVPLLLRYHYRNALYFNLKNGPWYIKLAVWPWSWWIALKQVFKIMIYHNREQSLAILRGFFDFYKNKMGKI